MSKMYLRGFAQRAEGDDADDGPIRFVIATEGRKADGLNLQMDRLDLTRFQANPVVMYGHQYWGRDALPIGRAEDVEVDGSELLASAVFDMDDEFAAKIDRKYRGGFLNAVSVGFDIHGLDDETGIPDEWELLEFSAVPIPLDPEAVKEPARARAAELAEAITELREGKVLSKGNKSLVEDAIDALQTLLSAANKADDEDEDDERSVAALEIRRRRLQLIGA